MNAIPTRIVGAQLVRHEAQRRSDGSSVVVRRSAAESPRLAPAHEELITAGNGYTCEPHYSRRSVRRLLGCRAGEVFVCLVDVRRGSPSFGHWQGFYLSGGDQRLLTVPAGVALGWQVVSPQATVELGQTRELKAEAWRWLPWNDPDVAIDWPLKPRHLASHTRRSRRFQAVPAQRLPLFRRRSKPTATASTEAPAPPREDDNLLRKPRSGSKVASAAGDRPRGPQSCPPSTEVKPSAQNCGSPTANRPSQPKNLVLVIGSSGQLGRDLCRHLRSLGTVVGACRTPDKGSVLPVPVWIDVSRPASLRLAIRQIRPTLIVNAAGLTDVDMAETNPRLAQMINASGPAIIADEAKRLGAGLVHFCTNMVFDGTGDKPWRETDAAAPQNQFARTKLLGTEAVQSSGAAHLILRCGWLYSTHGDNYVRRLIDALTYRQSVTLAGDHFGSPTSTDWLSRLVAQLLGTAGGDMRGWLEQHGGLYHASTLGFASKTEVGDQILADCRQHSLPVVLQKIHSRPLAELPSQARLPANCRLDASRLAMRFGLELPRWQIELQQQIALMLGDEGHSARSVA